MKQNQWEPAIPPQAAAALPDPSPKPAKVSWRGGCRGAVNGNTVRRRPGDDSVLDFWKGRTVRLSILTVGCLGN